MYDMEELRLRWKAALENPPPLQFTERAAVVRTCAQERGQTPAQISHVTGIPARTVQHLLRSVHVIGEWYVAWLQLAQEFVRDTYGFDELPAALSVLGAEHPGVAHNSHWMHSPEVDFLRRLALAHDNREPPIPVVQATAAPYYVTVPELYAMGERGVVARWGVNAKDLLRGWLQRLGVPELTPVDVLPLKKQQVSLRSCAHCKGSARIHPVDRAHQVRCENSRCGVRGPIRDTELYALEAWNKGNSLQLRVESHALHRLGVKSGDKTRDENVS